MPIKSSVNNSICKVKDTVWCPTRRNIAFWVISTAHELSPALLHSECKQNINSSHHLNDKAFLVVLSVFNTFAGLLLSITHMLLIGYRWVSSTIAPGSGFCCLRQRPAQTRPAKEDFRASLN